MTLQTSDILFDLLASDPASPVEGQLWYNTTSKLFKQYNGSETQTVKGYPFTVRTVDASNPNADYSTIQAAITAASSGDVILVGPGNYAEQLTLKAGVRIIGTGGCEEAGARTAITASLAGGSLITGPASGTAYLENIYAYLGHQLAFSHKVLDVSAGGSVTCLCCRFVMQALSGTAGTDYAVYVTGTGTVTLEHCYLLVGNGASGSITTIALGVANGTANLETTYSAAAGPMGLYWGVQTSHANSALTLSGGCTILGGLDCATASYVNLDGAHRIDFVNGQDDDDQDTILVNQAYGLLYTNGKNTAYKMALRANTADPAAPANGNVWYNATTKKLRYQLNSIIKSVGQWPFGKILTVDPTDPTADYSTLLAAVSAATSGDVIILSPGSYTLAARLYIPTGLTIVGGAGVCGRITTISLSAGNGGPVSVLYCNNGTVSLIGLAVTYTYNGSIANPEAMSVEGGGLNATDCRFSVNASTATGGTAIGLHLNGGGADLDNCECNVTDAVVLSSRSGCRIDTAETLTAQRTSFTSISDGLRIEHASATATLIDCSVPQTLRVTTAANVYLDGGTRVGTIVDTGSKVQVRGTPLDTYQTKAAPVAADRVLIADSADSYKYKSALLSGTTVAHQATHQSGASDVLAGLLDANARLAVSRNGAAVSGTRRQMNIIEGTGVTVTATDNAGAERVDVTVTALAGSIGDISPSKRAPTTSQTIASGMGLYLPGYYEIVSGVYLEIAVNAAVEVG